MQTDHANLLFWKSPHKLNRRTARWHLELQDYNFTLKHIAGKVNAAVDALSRPPGAEQGKEDNQEITMLDPKMFVRFLQPGDPGTTEDVIVQAQNHMLSIMDNWDKKEPLQKTSLGDNQYMWCHPESSKLVILPDQQLYHQVLQDWHNLPTAGHLGHDETMRKILEFYYWPNAKIWITQYMYSGMRGLPTKQKHHSLTQNSSISYHNNWKC